MEHDRKGIVTVRAERLSQAVERVENFGVAVLGARPVGCGDSGEFECEVHVPQNAAGPTLGYAVLRREVAFRRTGAPAIANKESLDTVTPEAAMRVVLAVERMTGFFMDCKDLLAEMLAGDGLGILAADAVTQAVKRAGAWTVVDSIAAFLFGRFADRTPDVEWASVLVGKLRTIHISGSWNNTEVMDPEREEMWEEVNERLNRDSTPWLTECWLYVARLAIYGTDPWHTQCDDDQPTYTAGFGIALALAEDCSKAAVSEFVQHVRSIGVREGGRHAA